VARLKGAPRAPLHAGPQLGVLTVAPPSVTERDSSPRAKIRRCGDRDGTLTDPTACGSELELQVITPGLRRRTMPLSAHWFHCHARRWTERRCALRGRVFTIGPVEMQRTGIWCVTESRRQQVRARSAGPYPDDSVPKLAWFLFTTAAGVTARASRQNAADHFRGVLRTIGITAGPSGRHSPQPVGRAPTGALLWDAGGRRRFTITSSSQPRRGSAYVSARTSGVSSSTCHEFAAVISMAAVRVSLDSLNLDLASRRLILPVHAGIAGLMRRCPFGHFNWRACPRPTSLDPVPSDRFHVRKLATNQYAGTCAALPCHPGQWTARFFTSADSRTATSTACRAAGKHLAGRAGDGSDWNQFLGGGA